MPVHNNDIAAIFEQMADLLEIQNDNPFRIRAYRNAARQVEGMAAALADMVARGEDLTELPGIGEDLAAKIGEIARTGKCKALEKLRRQLPAGITELLKVPGLGPRRVRTLYDQLKIRTIEQLAKAAKNGVIRELAGFGPKTERLILESLAAHATEPQRLKLAVAAQYAEPLRDFLLGSPGVRQVIIAGSYRRSRETVGDLDILATAIDTTTVMDRFVAYDEVSKVVSRGDTRSTVILKSGLQVDLRVLDPKSYGAALQYFTGSKTHNVAIRKRAVGRKLKISEYGVFRGRERIAGDTEESVYAAIGLPWIPPELRENRGEIEAAQKNKLPRLIGPGDLKGDLHVHTRATDGHNSLREMADAAREYGLEYLAITDHSRHVAVAHGLDVKHLRQQMEEIDRLNETLKGITLLKGIEVDILEDGALDLPDEVLGELDLVVGAVHSTFKLPRAKQTKRILKAMDHRFFTILAHPLARLLDSREPMDVDMLKIIRHARQRGCFLELNSQPERLDLPDIHCQLAREEKVLVAISSDGHRVQDFRNLDYGIGQARRGWLEKIDIVNTRSLRELRALIRSSR